MSVDKVTISLSGLSPLQVQELKQALAQADGDASSVTVMPEETGASSSKRHEPFTMLAVIAVSHVALIGLATYLAKGRSKLKKKERLVVTLPDGTKVYYEVETDAASEQQIAADLMGKLADLKIPLPAPGAH